MCDSEKDILVEIPDKNLSELAELYKNKAPWAPQMFSFVNTMKKWKANNKFKNTVTFWSPNSCWRQDGTIIVVVSLIVTQDVHVFTLDDKCTNLYEGLSKTNRINYGAIESSFYGVLDKFLPLVNKIISERNIIVRFMNPNITYAISPEQAKAFSINCPSEVYTKQLEPFLAEQINDLWPHKFPNSDKLIANLIEMNGGYGIFLRETDEMVAWIVKHVYGHLAMLHTKENFKRKGYATLLTKMLSKEIAEEGHWPVATIVTKNKLSRSMFENLGFNPIGNCHFIDIK